MKKTLKIAVAGVGVGVVSLAGAGLASAHTSGGGDAVDEMTDRVAEILGVDATELGDAFDQARDEVRTEKMDARLDAAVADGTITQDEADEIRAWMDLRPEVLDELKGARGHHGPRHDSEGGALAERLATLVEEGTITQEEADGVLAWSEDRPEALDEIRPEREGRRGLHHSPRDSRGPGRGFELRVGPGEDGEIGRFGGFTFRLPPGFDPGSETPPTDEAVL